MPKNVTVSIPDELANEMEHLPEVNWSQVARTAIKRYITIRRSPDMSELLEELEKQKDEEYVKGYSFADVVVKEMGYREFNILLQIYADRISEERKFFNPARMLPGNRSFSNEEIMIDLLREKKLVAEASESFSSGLTTRLFEIRKTMR